MPKGISWLGRAVCAGFFCVSLASGASADVVARGTLAPHVDRGFGSSVAISGNTAIVGGTEDCVYLFDLTTSSRIDLSTPGGHTNTGFGNSVAITGNTAIVGACGDYGVDGLGRFYCSAGAAFLFDATTGNEIARLTASEFTEYAYFGQSVAISGGTAIVGCPGDDHAVADSGAAYLFDVATGNEIAKLTASDAAEKDAFGSAVAIDGNIAIVGAVGDDDGGEHSGSAYLFDVTTGNQIAKLTASDAAVEDLFGVSVDISGNTAIVGAQGDGDGGENSGSAYLFDIASGNQIAKLTASDAMAYAEFGNSVAISGNIAIVGAWADSEAGLASGSAYVYDSISGDQIAKLTADDAAATDEFGQSVDIDGSNVIIGAPRDDYYGVAYLFQVPEPASSGLLALGGIVMLVRRRARCSIIPIQVTHPFRESNTIAGVV